MTNCELCKFNNPKATVTAIILKDNCLLRVLRNEEPFKGVWDLPGGYMEEEETLEFAIRRELNEEFDIRDFDVQFIKTFPGTALWKEKEFPILSHVFLVDIKENKIKLNEENSYYDWKPLKFLDPQIMAFDSNEEISQYAKDTFTMDFDRMKELVRQLDPNTEIKEHSFYKAKLCGKISQIYDGNKLIAMGWIFPRQTLLRYQAVVEDMIVDEAYRGKGYGRMILQELLNWARVKEIETVELTTNPSRIAANELYKSEGFKLHPTNHYLYRVDNGS